MPLRRISYIQPGAAFFLGRGKILIFTLCLILNGCKDFLMNAWMNTWKNTDKYMRRSLLTARGKVWSYEPKYGIVKAVTSKNCKGTFEELVCE